MDLTPKVVKVTADVEIYAGDLCVGTTTVDLTPKAETQQSQQTAHADHVHLRDLQQTFPSGSRR